MRADIISIGLGGDGNCNSNTVTDGSVMIKSCNNLQTTLGSLLSLGSGYGGLKVFLPPSGSVRLGEEF